MSEGLSTEARAPGPATGSRRAALAAAGLYLLVWLGLAPAYGPTWDAVRTELPYGEAFLACIVRGEPDYLALRFDPGLEHRDPHFDLSLGRLPWYAAWPATSVVGAAACQLLWTGLGVLPPLVAHHLPIGLAVALLVFVVFRLCDERFGRASAVLSVVFLTATPRFLAHSFNNLKDAPEAVYYNLAFLLACIAWRRRSRGAWLGFGALFALALAQRPNALFLVPQLLALLAGVALLARRRGERFSLAPARGLGWALVAAPPVLFLLTPAFWVDPAGRVAEQMDFYFRSTSIAGGAGPLGLGRIGWHGLGTVVIGTPISMLLLAVVGLLDGERRGEERLFLALGVVVPIGRTLLPGMRDYDGLRHFLEFHPPLAVLAGLGAARLVRLAVAPLPRPRLGALLCGAVLLAPTLLAGPGHHPNSLVFYNRLAGGVIGAREKGVEDATDYWGNSYWQGLAWLEANAEPGARVIVPVADHVARAAAPLVLTRELLVSRDASGPPPDVLYVMSIQRRLQEAAEVLDHVEGLPAVHEITVDGAPILRIHRLEGDEARAVHGIWSAQRAARQSGLAILKWLKQDPALLLRIRMLKREQGIEAAVQELAGHLPEELIGEAAQFVRLEFGAELESEGAGEGP